MAFEISVEDGREPIGMVGEMPGNVGAVESPMRTLLLLKPDVVAHPLLLRETLREVFASGIRVLGAQKIRMDQDTARKLYGVHEGKFFYNRLVRHVTSGESIALHVEGEPRSLLGSSRLWPLPTSEDDAPYRDATLRQRYALSDVRNVAHNSDDDTADEELNVFRPFENPKRILEQVQSWGLTMHSV